MLTNPLASNPDLATAVGATRLYVLVRDAYLSAPRVTADKLAALEGLRGAVTMPTRSCGGPCAGLRGCPAVDEPGCALTGVRLVEWLRTSMHESSRVLGPQDSAMALLDVLVSARPPRPVSTSSAAHTGDSPDWSAEPLTLLADAGAYAAAHVPVSSLHRLTRLHRAARRFLVAGSRIALPSRALHCHVDGPLDAVADMLGAVLGVCPPTARGTAAVLLDGRPITPALGLAGGIVFDRLTGATDFAGRDAFVGTALARVTPVGLIHHLASLECALRIRPTLRTPLAAALDALREDIAMADARDETQTSHLRAGRRAVELCVLRLGTSEPGRIAGLAMRRHLSW